jgi:metal-responsive CopG/Arc/MetJ family transcriptional regulator
MSSKITVVKSLRASQEFFDKCDLIAKAEGVDRNKLIVRIVGEYLDDFEWLEATTLGDIKTCLVFSKKDSGNE